VYEIKSLRSEGAGFPKAALYVQQLRQGGVITTLGAPGAPGTGGILPAPGGYLLFGSSQAGVIWYVFLKEDAATVADTQGEDAQDAVPLPPPITAQAIQANYPNTAPVAVQVAEAIAGLIISGLLLPPVAVGTMAVP
jgi:hypothetical protein